ncbi:hypothetical protein [Anatilimnocola aggregata]|uniref:hypothetical protein n=1 Tax=Anatilimnocola aggregata TaxID=2528021 RepID=UPI0011A3DDA5|nr:hypothetical protein [Anatilimnocola aggregata]
MLPSDHCFERFVSPLSNPFYFEDPRSLTEVRGIFLDNNLPAAIGGGDLQVEALQLRGRLTERWSVVMARLANINVNQPGGPAGLLSVPIGVKYNFVRDVECQRLLTVGLTYFIPGSAQPLPPPGGGDFHIYLSGGTQLGDCGHWLSATGLRLPADNFLGTQLWYWSNQWDYEVRENWYAVAGVNWFHYLSNSGAGFTGDIGGLDLLNLPAATVAGNDFVTGVVGGKWKPTEHWELGLGYEFPLTGAADILRDRLYVDVVLRY